MLRKSTLLGLAVFLGLASIGCTTTVAPPAPPVPRVVVSPPRPPVVVVRPHGHGRRCHWHGGRRHCHR